MSEATKGSDVRAAYVDIGAPKCHVCQMPMNGSVECHLPSCTLRVLQEADVEARVQAASVEMRERCAVFVQDNEGHDPDCPWYYSPDDDHVVNCTCEAKELADKVCALPIHSNAYDVALLRARLEQHVEDCNKNMRAAGFATGCQDWPCDTRCKLERQLAALEKK